MKSAFAAMLRAGITNAVFSARCDFLDRRGFLALNEKSDANRDGRRARLGPAWSLERINPHARRADPLQCSPGAVLERRRLL